MSLELKAKQVKENYYVFSLGYCDAPHILKKSNKLGYTCGVYGWNSDVFTFNDVAVSTGYRPFHNVTDKQNEEGKKIIMKYEKKAKKAEESFDAKKHNYNYTKLYEKLETLYFKMFHELKQILINE